VQFARMMSEYGWMVITGAGDGIMAAGHGGAGRQASFGVSIRLLP
ncbi:MAG: cytochrome D ubiquinol oxidase subunit II, partial [Phycisphaerales bacterium]|nr:cytochrome D ubiquinol oxidase subunit II [Phycisphaerales bacterium]